MTKVAIPPWNTGAGACDQIYVIQSNTVLRLVLLQKNWTKYNC